MQKLNIYNEEVYGLIKIIFLIFIKFLLFRRKIFIKMQLADQIKILMFIGLHQIYIKMLLKRNKCYLNNQNL